MTRLSRASIFAIASIFCQAMIIITLKYATTFSELSLSHPAMWLIMLAAVLLISRVILWNKSLSLAPLSYVYTYTAIGPVVLVVLSIVLLNESLNLYTMVGTIIISLGIYLRITRKQVDVD